MNAVLIRAMTGVLVTHIHCPAIPQKTHGDAAARRKPPQISRSE